MFVPNGRLLYQQTKTNKKGVIGTIQNLVIGIVIVAIVLGLGFIFLDEFVGQTDAGSQARNSTTDIVTELSEIPSWLGIVILAVIMVGLLGLVMILKRYNR